MMDQLIMVTWEETKDLERASYNIKMEINTLEIGSMTRSMEEECIFSKMERDMKEKYKTDLKVDLESTCTRMEMSMKAVG